MYSHSEGESPKESSQVLKLKAGLFRQKSRNDRFGFTLAEVLITLGIIGVVAALTLPSIISRNQKKQLELALKKQYTVAQQALLQMATDREEPVKAGDFPVWTFAKEYSVYFNILRYCGNTGCVGQESGDGGYDVKTYKTYNKSRIVMSDKLDDGQFQLVDGATYIIENPDPASKRLFITVDVNGYKKLPNAWGHDLFTFQITEDGKFLPMGAAETLYVDKNKYCSPTSSNGENGIGCTYAAMTDPNYWKNLP